MSANLTTGVLCWAYLAGLFLALAYALEIARSLRRWKQLPECNIPPGFEATTNITVVVPARNEAANIVACLQSLLHQDYPEALMEVVVVDDFSSDNTVGLVRQFSDPRVRLLELRNFVPPNGLNSYKKKSP